MVLLFFCLFGGRWFNCACYLYGFVVFVFFGFVFVWVFVFGVVVVGFLVLGVEVGFVILLSSVLRVRS